jgi:hypothetical protein
MASEAESISDNISIGWKRIFMGPPAWIKVEGMNEKPKGGSPIVDFPPLKRPIKYIM